jgi:hypothetical protein
VSRSCPRKLTAAAALLLSILVIVAGPAFANTRSAESLSDNVDVVFEVDAADTQPADQTHRAPRDGVRRDAPGHDERDRRVLAALAFTVIGTIGMITIGSVVLLTQPGDRQVMVRTEPADASEQAPPAPVPTTRAARDGKKPSSKRHVRRS